MIISGIEKGLGAVYEAKRLENNQLVYGIAIIKVDNDKSYLIQRFETNDFVDGAPAQAYFIAVKTNSIILVEDEDNSCQNCGECKCFSCEYREGGHGGDCTGRCCNCGDEPIDKCDSFKYADW